jgi:hypothetical protein
MRLGSGVWLVIAKLNIIEHYFSLCIALVYLRKNINVIIIGIQIVYGINDTDVHFTPLTAEGNTAIILNVAYYQHSCE